MRTKTIQQSYGGGRMSPDMTGRPEDARGRSGLAKATNVRTTTSGALESRTGFQYCAESVDSARTSIVRPFVSSPTEAVALVIEGWDGDPTHYGTIRFLSNGALVPSSVLPAFWTYAGSVGWTISPLAAGTPIRVTITNHGRVAGSPVRFTTTGVLPGPLSASVTYYVKTVVDANNFTVAYEPSGAEVVYDGVTSPTGFHAAHWRYLHGDAVTHLGTGYTALQDTSAVVPGVTSGWESYWYQHVGPDLQVPHQYADADLLDLDMSSQEGNVLTIAHRGYKVRELVRESSTFWRLRDATFTASVKAPQWSTNSIVPYAGEVFDVSTTGTGLGGTPTRYILQLSNEHPYAVGEVLYVSGMAGLTGLSDGFYAVGAKNGASTTIDLRTVTGGQWVSAVSGTYTGGGTVRSASTSSILSNFYRITSVDQDGRESEGGAAAGALNNLEVGGSYNVLTWLPAVGASRYRVYRATNGQYQLLGETSDVTFRDVGDGTDASVTLPLFDSTINSTANNYPNAAGLFEGRRFLFSTSAKPLGGWGTRSGSSNDLSYHIPVLPDDRLSFGLRTQSGVILHAVPQSGTLLLMTDAEEIRLAATESGALTADQPIPARTITRNGSTRRRPVANGGTVVFENRGGRVLELGFRSDAGWQVQSLVERCGDWFDGQHLRDGIAAQLSPIPTLWMVHTDGRLLGLTYAPEEAVAGWHEHTTSGAFESVCAIPEGGEDVLYVVVRREINGATVRYYERSAPRRFVDVSDRRHLDCFGTFDGTNTTATTLTLTGGTTWAAGESITLTASAALFAYPATTDVGDRIKWLGLYRVRITGTSSTTVATGVIEDSFAAAPSGASAVWTFGRDTVGGLAHLEGERVQVVADGVVLSPQTVTGGVVALRDKPTGATVVGYKVHVGLGYRADAVTMPPGIPIDGLGHGRAGSVSHAHVRMRRSAPFKIGPYGGNAAAFNLTHEGDDFSGPSREVVSGKWGLDKQVHMIQDDPLPMVVVGAVYTVAWGD